jgi:hypothetical protein
LGGGILDPDAGEDETGDCEESCAGEFAGACAGEDAPGEELWAATPRLALTSKARNQKRISLFYPRPQPDRPLSDAGVRILRSTKGALR